MGLEFGGKVPPSWPRDVQPIGLSLAAPGVPPKDVRSTHLSQDQTTTESNYLELCPSAAIQLQRSKLLISEILKGNPPVKVAGFKLRLHTPLLTVHVLLLYALTIVCPLAAVI